MINAISSNNFQTKSYKKDISMTSKLPKAVLNEAVKVAEEMPKIKIPAYKKIIMNFRKGTDWLFDYQTKHIYDKNGNLSEIHHNNIYKNWNGVHNNEIISYKDGKIIGMESRIVKKDNTSNEKILEQTFYNEGRLTKVIKHYDEPVEISGEKITKQEIDFTKTYGTNNNLYKQRLTDINKKEHIRFLEEKIARLYWI